MFDFYKEGVVRNRRDAEKHLNRSLAGLEADALDDLGIRVTTTAPRPEVLPTQKAVKNAEPTRTENTSVYEWTVADKPPEEILDSIPWQTYIEARKALVKWINGLTAQILDLYPEATQQRWKIEEAAARAVIAGNADAEQTAIVTDEGATKGRTPAEHAASIIANADRYKAIANEVNKLFLPVDQALQDAESPLEYPAIFEAAKLQVAPLAAAYGLEINP